MMRRSQTSSPAIQGRGISLADWEATAPLDELEITSVGIVREACNVRPLPEKYANAEAGPSRPMTPSGSATPGFKKGQPHSLLQSALGISRPPSEQGRSRVVSGVPSSKQIYVAPTTISTAQQFHEHFSHLTSSLSHSQDSAYRAHLEEVSAYGEACKIVGEELQHSEETVDAMMGYLKWVEERGESLRIAGETLMQEEYQLNLQTTHLSSRLSYFTFLEQAQRMLNNPGEELVLSDGFLAMVERLDSCLTYLKSHRDFRDAEIYLIRYQQCMTRSMTLIKLYVVNALRSLAQEVQKRTSDTKYPISETAAVALLYTKFTSYAFPLRPLLAELELRASENPTELGSLLDDCHATWVSVRKALIGPRVEREVKRMDPAVAQIVDLTRSGCGYLKGVCSDEYMLYMQFFSTGDKPIYAFLEGLCDHLYDHLRPRILHEMELSTLCDVCTVLQGLMIADLNGDDMDPATPSPVPDAGAGSYFPAYYSPSQGGLDLQRYQSYEAEANILPHRPDSYFHAGKLLGMVLRDVQTRMIFRSQAILRSDVGSYAPKGDDLDYPAKIQNASHLVKERQTFAVSLDDDDEENPAFLQMPEKETQETWYPSLRSTLWILSLVHTFVETNVFEDLAEEAISTCRQSLLKAAQIFASRKKDAQLDSQLFLIRHLLILKEMTASVDIVSRSRAGISSGGVIATLSALLAGALNMVGVGGLLGLRPEANSRMAATAKDDVDRELKRVCEEAIAQCGDKASSPLRKWLDRCTHYLSAKSSRGQAADLASQDWATPQKVKETHDAFRENAAVVISDWISNLVIYLQDEATVRVLIPPMQNHVMDTYRTFHDIVRAEYDQDLTSCLMTPPAMLSMLKRLENDALQHR